MHLIMKGTQNIQQKGKEDTTVYVEAVAPRDILSLEPWLWFTDKAVPSSLRGFYLEVM